MKITISRIFALTLALCMAFTLLTACSNGGDSASTPTGNNSTPGVSDTETPGTTTPGATDPMLDDTTEPPITEPTIPGTSEMIDPTTRPTRPDVTLKYDEEKKAITDVEFTRAQRICDNNGIDIDLDEAIKGAFDDYWEFFDERVTYEAFRTAFSYLIPGMGGKNLDENNISKIETGSFEQASDYVVSKGGKALDITDPKQNIAAWAIAITLNYQTNFLGMNDPVADLGTSFGFGLSDGEDYMGFASIFSSFYYVIME